MKFYTSDLFVSYLSLGARKIKILKFYLTGIYHFSSEFRLKSHPGNLFNIIDVFVIIQFRIIKQSLNCLIKRFGSIYPLIFKTHKYISEFELITKKRLFRIW